MKFKPYKILVFLLLLLTNNTYSQDMYLIDSLKVQLNNLETEKSIIKTNLQIGDEYKYSFPEKAIIYYQKALDISNKLNNDTLKAKSLKCLAAGHYYTGDLDLSIQQFSKSLELFTIIKDSINIANCLNSIGSLYDDQGKYQLASNMFFETLAIFDKLGDKIGISKCYNNIGNLNSNQENYDKALEYYQKSLNIDIELNNLEDISFCYNNIGIVYREKKMYDKSIEYFNKALMIDNEMDNKQAMSYAYNNIGNVYLFKNEFENALNYYLKSLDLKIISGNKLGIATVLGNIASLNNEIAYQARTNKEKSKKHFLQAINYATKGMKIAKEIASIELQNTLAFHLQVAYKNIKDFEKALEFAELNLSTKDSLFCEEKTNAIAEMQIKYESNEKDLKISNQKKDKKIVDIEMNRQQNLIIVFVLIGIIILILLFLL